MHVKLMFGKIKYFTERLIFAHLSVYNYLFPTFQKCEFWNKYLIYQHFIIIIHSLIETQPHGGAVISTSYHITAILIDFLH